VCRKIENPSGTIQINQDGLIMTLVIGTYPDVDSPNQDNAVTSFSVDPSSLVKSGTITIKGGPDAITYDFGSSPPLHAPAVSSGKWPTISHVEVCWQKPHLPELGRVEVTKVVVGEGAPDDMVFAISLTPEGGSAITKSITGAGKVVFEDLEPGVYALSEENPGSDWEVSYSTASITVKADETAKATITNTYSPPVLPELGRVEVTKVVVGEGAPDDMVFAISLTPEGGSAITKSITGAGKVVFEDLEPGVYALSEENPGSDWEVSYSTASITVLAGDTALATVTNTYARQVVPPELGSVVVTKIVTGEPPAATYQIGLVGPAPATTERWLTVVGAGQVTFSGLPIGSYTVVERDPGEGYTVTIAPTWLDVTNGGVANVTVTNAYVEQESAPPTVPPTTLAGAGGQVTTAAPTAGQSLPHTGAEGGLALVALSLVAGGAALAGISRRRRVV
jgi:LPXTG-motif cell wall-anchored protein